MAITSSTLRRLSELGLSSEQMSGVLSIVAEMAEADERRKESQRKRKRRSRDNDVTVTGQVSDAGVTRSVTPPDKEKSPTPPKEINPPEPIGSDSVSARELFREFNDAFWPLWPSHVAKKPALKAFKAARKREDLETILDGVRRYMRTKPPDRDWMHPATFLNQERWNDQPASPPIANGKPKPHDAFFAALAEQSQAGNGARGREADADVGVFADDAGSGKNPANDLELSPADYRRTG